MAFNFGELINNHANMQVAGTSINNGINMRVSRINVNVNNIQVISGETNINSGNDVRIVEASLDNFGVCINNHGNAHVAGTSVNNGNRMNITGTNINYGCVQIAAATTIDFSHPRELRQRGGEHILLSTNQHNLQKERSGSVKKIYKGGELLRYKKGFNFSKRHLHDYGVNTGNDSKRNRKSNVKDEWVTYGGEEESKPKRRKTDKRHVDAMMSTTTSPDEVPNTGLETLSWSAKHKARGSNE